MRPVLLAAAALVAGAALLGAAPAPRADLAGKVVILPVSDEEQFMVDEGMAQFLERRIREAEAGGAKAILLEIDTYGGAVHSALKISDLLLNTTIPRTVAFVRTKAISAGALIAMSCKEIVMNPNTTIGDCEPILQGPEGIQEGPEKFKTALRARFRLFGYPAAIGEGMVDKDIEVYEGRLDGKKQYFTETDLENLKRRGTEPANLQMIKKKGHLLTMTAAQALEYGVAKALVQDLAEVLAHYGWSPADAVEIQPTWSEWLARWVQSPVVAGLLLMVGLIAVYVAVNHPGLGAPEAIAIVCFGLLFGGKYLAGLAESWEILLFVAGVLLLLIEVFVTPGFGAAGFAGIALILAALFLAFLPSWTPAPAPPAAPHSPPPVSTAPAVDWGPLVKETAAVILAAFAGALVAILAMIRYMGSIPILNRMVLTGTVSGQAVSVGGAASGAPEGAALPGRRGRAVTTLRPAGRAEIDGRMVEVATEGEYIDRGVEVVVDRVEGMRVIVRRA